jgi:hypothetical protein
LDGQVRIEEISDAKDDAPIAKCGWSPQLVPLMASAFRPLAAAVVGRNLQPQAPAGVEREMKYVQTSFGERPL